MKPLNNSQPLAVATQFSPLSCSFYIEVLGGMSTVQFYQQAQNKWIPDHSKSVETDTNGSQYDGVLRLAARYSIVDPDGMVGQSNLSPQIFWFVDGVQITTTVSTADYYVQSNILYIRKNFTHQQGATVVCECRFTDPRTLQSTTLSDTLSLSSILKSDEIWTLSLLCDRTRKHFPVNSVSSVYTFEADARFGSDLMNNKVSWFWDYSTDDGVTWKQIDAACTWYVSGANTSILRVDMDFIERLTVRVRIATTTNASAPDIHNFATASIAWRYPVIRSMVFSYGGDKVFVETTSMRFGVHCHLSKHNDMTESQKKEWLMFDWGLRQQGASGITSLQSYQRECVLSAHKLFNTTNQKFIVDPRISMRGIYIPLATHDGDAIQTSSGDDIFYRS